MNRISQLFNIRFPLIQAGMVWCSGWELAAAVSNAGGLGLIGSGSMDAEVLRTHIRKCKAATDKPFGVNVPLLYRHAGDNIQVIIEEGVKIVFTSAGNPKAYTSQLKETGITVVHVVSSVKFAQKAEAAGVDAIVAEGFEAGGHNGREETTTLVLIPQVARAVKIPVIAAGGIGSGAAMLAVMVLGADGVQIGSRFVTSEESSAHLNFKTKVVEAGEGATQLTLKELAPVRLIKNEFFEEIQDAYKKGATKEELKELLGRGRSKSGMFEGDLKNGELEIGQISGNIQNILPAAQIVKEIITEYHQHLQNLNLPHNQFLIPNFKFLITKMVYHLTTLAQWEKYLQHMAGDFMAPSLKTEGFIHCSTKDQVLESAERHFAGEEELVVLCIVEKRVKNLLKWEPSRNEELFPHIYGGIPLEAIETTESLQRDGKGKFDWQ